MTRSPARGVSGAGPPIGERHVVLHLSGSQGQEALGPLVTSAPRSAPCIRSKQIVEPELAPARLKGAWAAVEGMPRAVEAGERIAQDLGMRPFRIATKAKPIYHAGAVFASNYLVVVGGRAQRLLRHAGYPMRRLGGAAAPGRGNVRISAGTSHAKALTGPVSARYRDESAAPAIAGGGYAKLYRALGRRRWSWRKQGWTRRRRKKARRAGY